MKERILFLYTSGRKARIEKASRGEAPREFFYGYTYFKQNGYDVNYLETDYLLPPRLSFEHWHLKRKNSVFAQHLGIGNRSHFFVNQIKHLNSYDLLIATTDSIALGLAHHKKKGKLKADIIYLNMGLARALGMMSQVESNRKYDEYRNYCKELICQCRTVVSVGKGEHQFFIDEFPDLKEKFVFIPFGVDTDFWTSSNNVKNDDNSFVLFVGNDKNRDYELLIQVADSCPDMQFKFVTSRLTQVECPKNVELIMGNWRNAILSDINLKNLICSSSLIVIPLKDSFQPSGQSVALQAMACEIPIVITRTRGLWDPLIMQHLENCFLVSPDDLNGFLNGIHFIMGNSNEAFRLGKNGRKTVKTHYSSDQFAQELHSFF